MKPFRNKKAAAERTFHLKTESEQAVETHCHTLGGSHCAKVSAKETVQLYKEAGYDTLILTNHYNKETSLTPDYPPKRPRRGVNHPPPSIADVKEGVEVYLYSPSVPSLQAIG